MSIKNYLNQHVLSGLNRPTGQAAGLPPELYTSDEFFAYERKYLFSRSWIFVATTDELSEPGTAIPVVVAGRPVVIVSDRNGKIRAFHNTCSHRGTLLVSQPCHRQAWLRCPYHSWVYWLDGTVKATPNIGGHGVHSHADLDVSQHGLTPVRCETWHRLVFVNLCNEGPSLAEYVAPLAARWPIDYGCLRLGGMRSFEFKANWKLVIENFLESYHLPVIHPGLNSYSPMKDHYNIFISPNAFGQATKKFAPRTSIDGKSLPAIPNYPMHLNGHGEYPVLFPNLMLGTQATEFFAITCEPIGPELTRERYYLFFAEAAMTDEFAKVRNAILDRWFEVNTEDVGVVERMQQGRHCAAWSGGVFAPDLEACVHHFEKQVVATILEGHSDAIAEVERPPHAAE
jgi:choline monooxygenase